MLGPVIGAGGFALVVRARDESLDTDVAIKVLRPGPALDLEVRERFVREARLLRRVRHPVVVTVHDIGETEDGRPYLVMDVAEGGTLADRLGTVVLPPDPADIEAVVTALAEGLGALHDAGVVHRDVKPANLLVLRDGGSARAAKPMGRLLGPGERLVIGDLGLAKDQLATAYGPTMLGGTPGFMAPEQAEVGAQIDRRADVYGATAVLWVVVTGDQPPVADELVYRLGRVPEPWRALFESGLAAERANRFATMTDWAAAAARAIGATGGTAPATQVVAPPTAVLPYKGLAAFDTDDAALFFGRRELVDQLVVRLQQHPVLVVGGPSGSGKSSLVRAGLVPALAGGALPGSERWPVRVLVPGHDPSPIDDSDGGGLIVVDQLEEVFTLCDDDAVRAAFIESLRRASARTRVVLCVRADFYGACAAHPWLADAITENHVLVGPMTEAQLRDVVVGPARAVGLQVEPALVDRIVADAGSDAGALPLVAHALVETWLRREENRLTLAGYDAAGGVAGAIGRTAEEVWAHLDEDDRHRARRLMLRLVQPGDGTPDTKRFLPWDEAGSDDAMRRVATRFADTRLVTVDERGLQLAHEALIGAWDRLRGWLDESREELRAGIRISDAAREWQAQGRDPDLLYRGTRLAGALEWRERNEDALADQAAAFLAAGAQREQWAQRARRRAITALVVLTALALVATAVAGIALRQSRGDERAARDASALSLATTAASIAETDPYLAALLAAEASAQRPELVDARDALVRSREALAGDGLVPFGDPVPVGDVLAIAVRTDGEVFATGDRDGMVVVRDTRRRGIVSRLRGPTSGVAALTFTADGRWLVAASDRQIWRWPVGSAGAIDEDGTVLAEGAAPVWSVAAAAAGTLVAATTGGGEVLLIDVATSAPPRPPIRSQGSELVSVAFSPAGDVLLAGSGRGAVHRWSLPSGQPHSAPVAAHTSEVWEIVALPDGGFVTVSSDGTAKAWDARGSRRATVAVPAHVRGGTVGPAGNVLTLGGSDGALYSWSLADARSVGSPQVRHRERVTAAARSADRRTLVTLSDDQTVQVWSQRPRPAALVRMATEGEIRSLAVAPDGSTVAIGTPNGDVRVLSNDGTERTRLRGHGGEVRALAFTSAARVVSGDAEGTLRLWDVRSGRRLHEQRGAHRGTVTSLATRSALISGGADGSVVRWSAKDLSDRRVLGRLPGEVTDADVAEDGDVVASSSVGAVGRWDASGNEVGEVLRVARNAVAAVAFNRDTIVTLDANETLSVWSRASRPTKLAEGSGFKDGGNFAIVDGTTAAITDRGGTLRLGDATTARPIGSGLRFAEREALYVASAPGGVVWVAARDGTLARYDGLSVRSACALGGEAFDVAQRDRYLPSGEVSCGRAGAG